MFMFIFVQHRTRCSTPELRTSLSRTSAPSCASLRLRKRPNPHTDRERAVQKLVSPLLLSKAMATEDGAALQATVPTVERALGYRFRDQRLLLTALTHRSFCHENNTASGDFDELEWLGDSVLQLAISSWLFSSARGSRRSSGQLSRTRQRFVDAGACESFALQLNLFPFLRIGQGQPVRGTKILADCFEAVLGAVYVDAGGCSDLEPVHGILARVIPSYEHGRWSTNQPRQQRQHRSGPQVVEEPQRIQGEEPRKLMNLVHRLTQMAKHLADGSTGVPAAAGSPHLTPGVQRDPIEVLRHFDAHLRGFHENALRGGALSFASRAFAEAFGQDVARFFEAAASDPEKCRHLDNVLAGSSMLRKHFAEAPQGAERVVMEVVPVPSEVRLQCFTVVESLLTNVLRQGGEPGQRVVRLIESAPHGAETIAFLSNAVAEAATSLLLTGRQRSVVRDGLNVETIAVASSVGDHHIPREVHPPPPPLGPSGAFPHPPPFLHGPGGPRGALPRGVSWVEPRGHARGGLWERGRGRGGRHRCRRGDC